MTEKSRGLVKHRGARGRSYDVGYGKPPRQHQFKKGHSGNPKGRRRGSQSLLASWAKELSAVVTINENGRTRRITKCDAALKQLANGAAQGDIRHLKLFLQYHEALDRMADEKLDSNKSFQYFVDLLNKIAAEKACNIPDKINF